MFDSEKKSLTQHLNIKSKNYAGYLVLDAGYLVTIFNNEVSHSPLTTHHSLLSGRRGSNSPPIAWKAIALPNELLPLKKF